MILVLGGMCQGKHCFCRKEFPEAELIDDFEYRIREQLKQGKDPVKEAESWIGDKAGFFSYDSGVSGDESEGIKDSGSDSAAEKREIVIIMREVGSGVVPMDREEREWREAVGRVSCIFASRADRVYRLLAGIPQRLK
ncbi:adenosyl cobinamide kinase/adenosyl cobinamide phosphate guanylyltransferase [Lachnospiraceae bacterium JC7]|nr:adenosyl cobinamide kinase/adenosyl cobinamide phosphate guanylyltransferase [Lachnospiraceae bacterium JC7]